MSITFIQVQIAIHQQVSQIELVNKRKTVITLNLVKSKPIYSTDLHDCITVIHRARSKYIKSEHTAVKAETN